MQAYQMRMLCFGFVRMVSGLDDSCPNSIDYIGQGSKVSLDRTAIKLLKGIISMVQLFNFGTAGLDTYLD